MSQTLKLRDFWPGRSCIVKCLILLLALAGLCSLTLFFPPPIASWNIGQGQIISVHGEVFYEVNRAISFQVTEGFFTVVHDGCILFYEFPGEPHQFGILRTRDNSVMAILDYEFDNPLLAMYDVENGESWPCDVEDKRRDFLFEKLKQEHPDLERQEYW